MRFLLAAFDPADPSPSKKYWAWHHSSIPADVLDHAYYGVLAKQIPVNIEALDRGDVCAGATTVEGGWLCWYRFYHGGRDTRGRPGRYVILCLFTQGKDAGTMLLSGFPNLSEWNKISRDVVRNPIPVPPSLDVDVEVQPPAIDVNPIDLKQFLEIGKAIFSEPLAWEKALALIPCIPESHGWHCLIMSLNGVCQAEVHIERRVAPPEKVAPVVQPVPQGNSEGPPRKQVDDTVWSEKVSNRQLILASLNRFASILVVPVLLALGTQLWWDHSAIPKPVDTAATMVADESASEAQRVVSPSAVAIIGGVWFLGGIGFGLILIRLAPIRVKNWVIRTK